MKQVVLFIAAISALPTNAVAAEDLMERCSKDKTSVECKAFISGYVHGYIASKQNYVAIQSDFDSDYEKRAFVSRAGKQRLLSPDEKPACLPADVDKNEVISKMRKLEKDADIEQSLGDYLRKHYPCKK